MCNIPDCASMVHYAFLSYWVLIMLIMLEALRGYSKGLKYSFLKGSVETRNTLHPDAKGFVGGFLRVIMVVPRSYIPRAQRHMCPGTQPPSLKCQAYLKVAATYFLQLHPT